MNNHGFECHGYSQNQYIEFVTPLFRTIRFVYWPLSLLGLFIGHNMGHQAKNSPYSNSLR